MQSKNFSYILLLSLLTLLSSCSHIISEMEALKKSDKGVAELNNGQYDKAIELFQEAIASRKISKGTRATIYRNIAQAYIHEQIQDSAIHYATLAANCYDKNSYGFLVNIADVQILSDRIDLAVHTLSKAYKLNPYDLAVNNSLGLIYLGEYDYEFMDLEKALPHNKKAFEINKDRNTEYVLAKNYFELERFSDAEKHFENLYNHYPHNLDHGVFLGMVKYQLDLKAEAEDLWNQALAIDSTYQWVIESYKEDFYTTW